MNPRFAVNCSILFTELPLLERAAAAKAAGFEAVEFWWPFDRAVPSDAEVDAFVNSLEGVQLIGLNFFAGDMPAGERGVLSNPARALEFRESVPVLARIAERTGVRAFNALYGQRVEGVAEPEQDRVAVANLKFAAETVGAFGGTILIESLASPINGAYPLVTAADAVAVVERVNHATGLTNTKLLFDTFHLASNGERLSKVIETYGPEIGHVQIADVPGRGRPGTGGLDFGVIFTDLDRAGYKGWTALEFKAQGPTLEEFDWMRSYV